MIAQNIVGDGLGHAYLGTARSIASRSRFSSLPVGYRAESAFARTDLADCDPAFC
jgi:hypothetical protein